MSGRLEGVQVALPRAVDAQAQQHAAQRAPVAAQEHAAAQAQQRARAQEERPTELEGAAGGRVRNEVLPDIEDTREEPRSGGRRRPPRRRAASAAPAATARVVPPEERGGGLGSRVDVRL